MKIKRLAARNAALGLPLLSLALIVHAGSSEGTFSQPFAEPTIVVDGQVVETDDKCVTNSEGLQECKTAAGTMALLEDGRILYLNALEGTENVELSIVAEFGEVSVNDQTRVLELGPNDTPHGSSPPH